MGGVYLILRGKNGVLLLRLPCQFQGAICNKKSSSFCQWIKHSGEGVCNKAWNSGKGVLTVTNIQGRVSNSRDGVQGSDPRSRRGISVLQVEQKRELDKKVANRQWNGRWCRLNKSGGKKAWQENEREIAKKGCCGAHWCSARRKWREDKKNEANR